MPFPGLTRLDQAQVLTPEIWNELMDLLEAKFSGAVGTNDLTYPLILGGDIDFGQAYGILGLRQFWNIINASEYATLDAAVSAAEAAGGGMVLIPPDTTITANNVSIDSSNVAIVGCGPSSVVQITAASTNPLFTTASTGLSGIIFSNLTLDGTGGGAGCIGIRARRITRLNIHNVYMTAFTGDFIVLTNDGVAGNATTDTRISNLHCAGGSDSHIFADDVTGLYINGMLSKNATGTVIDIVPASSSHLAQDIMIANVAMATGGAKGIRVTGTGGAAIDAHSRISLSNCRAVSMTGVPYELGGAAAFLKLVSVNNCRASGAAGDALRIAATGGSVTGCLFDAATGDGIDMSNSVDLFVSGNNCENAGAYGINASTTTTCRVIGNNCSDAVTDGINRTSSVNLVARENLGDDAPTIGNVFSDFSSYTKTAGSGTGTIGAFTYTIPANSFKTGDVLRVTARITQGGGGSGDVSIRAGGTSLGQVAVDATDNAVTWLVRILQSGAGTNSMITNVREGAANILITNSSTVDWTTDKAITFHAETAPLGADIVVNGIFIELLGSK